jgi:N-acyl-D-aspartate/D-glutamate deacylase
MINIFRIQCFTWLHKALFLVVLFSPGTSVHAAEFDVLITGGRIVDGTGNPWYYGDVGINDGRITAVGHIEAPQADHIINAEGLVVSPGFIDLHTHTDLLGNGMANSKIRQGVTVDIMGERDSVAPRDGLGESRDGPSWITFTEYFNLLERQGISMNIISHVSEGQIRLVVKGYDPSPSTASELEQMKALLERSLREGAWGLVTRFESGGPAHPEEVLELARITASHDSVYFSHIGSEGFEQQMEMDFAIRVAEETGIPVHILHLKIRGQELWDQMPHFVNQIQQARDRGLDITANQYPYTAMSHGWSANFPLWMREEGPERFAEMLRDESLRPRIKSDPEFIAWSKEHGWWEGIVMATASEPDIKIYEGMSLADIAESRGERDPADTFITLMAAEGGNIRGVFHNQSEENVRLVMRQPWVSVASDGSAMGIKATSVRSSGVPHPRNYGTNVRVLGQYVRETKVLTLEDAVRKMTSLPAQILGMDDRGQIREGFAADVVVFDPDTVSDTNSYEEPKSYAAGVPYVLVNGVIVIDKGNHTGATPGKILRRPGYDYVDVSAMKCPSSYDEVAKRFRSENYWIFQKRRGEDNVSMVLRPNRDTGTWRRDVDTTNNPMTVTPDYYEWESVIFTGINTLNRKDLTLDRERTDNRSATSQCERVNPEVARAAVESRYQLRLEGNQL